MKAGIASIFFGFKEIFKWHTMKYALLSGFIVSALWIGIGIFFWDPIVGVASAVLDWVPFSMVRSNGAWMLSTFLWFQIVLITFAIMYAFFGNLIFHDTTKENYGQRSLAILVVIALGWAVVWYFEGHTLYEKFLQLLTSLPFQTVKDGIGDFFGLYLIYSAIIVSMLFAVSFFSEPLIKHIEAEHFKEDEVIKDNVFKSFKYTLKDTVIFVILSLVTFPLLFMPFINLIIQVAIWIWLTKDTIQYDAASLVFEKVEPQSLKEHRAPVWFISFITVLFNFVPILNLFGPFFGEIAMFHYWKTVAKK